MEGNGDQPQRKQCAKDLFQEVPFTQCVRQNVKRAGKRGCSLPHLAKCALLRLQRVTTRREVEMSEGELDALFADAHEQFACFSNALSVLESNERGRYVVANRGQFDT